MDGDHNGAFTEQLLKVWNQGGFQGNYGNFHARIKARMPATPVAEPVHARQRRHVPGAKAVHRLMRPQSHAHRRR